MLGEMLAFLPEFDGRAGRGLVAILTICVAFRWWWDTRRESRTDASG